MLINVVDLETCDFEAGVVEVAMVAVGGADGEFFAELCKPDCPISYEAMATHHITEEMVSDKDPFFDVLADRGFIDPHPDVIFAAHNAEFDRKFFPEKIRDHKWIDTWRCALHLWPEAPSHSNQVLRYWLGLDVRDMPEEAGGTPHRALYDAWVTAKILQRMLENLKTNDAAWTDNEAVEHLLKLSSEPVVLRKVRFGKHRDKLWEDVANTDRSYLRWVLGQKDMNPDVIHTCKHHLGMIT